ncbi:MAG: ATP-binding cassette domain-containing protein, partial [Bacteroidota bacterium]|nr:ATP-binding cassette domain-containing protein [Bacteroidota bacterium]
MMIEIKQLQKNYGGRTVVTIPELGFEKGETIGVVGNNGAGKTTFFRLLLDLIRADKGTVLSKAILVAGSDHW